MAPTSTQFPSPAIPGQRRAGPSPARMPKKGAASWRPFKRVKPFGSSQKGTSGAPLAARGAVSLAGSQQGKRQKTAREPCLPESPQNKPLESHASPGFRFISGSPFRFLQPFPTRARFESRGQLHSRRSRGAAWRPRGCARPPLRCWRRGWGGERWMREKRKANLDPSC